MYNEQITVNNFKDTAAGFDKVTVKLLKSIYIIFLIFNYYIIIICGLKTIYFQINVK